MRAAGLLPGCALLALAACSGPSAPVETAPPPPVGHYEGAFTLPGQPELRAALDIRHPRRGHYAAEWTVPQAGALSFVGDTAIFAREQLVLTRPGRPGQQLKLRQEGDFWRGTLQLDSVQAAVVLVKRGQPTPMTYTVEEFPRPAGTAWRYAPADTGTPGAALVLLPDAGSAAAAALWADALARGGIIVLTLPAADTASAGGEAGLLRSSLRILRHTLGADTANVGVWAAGPRATAVLAALQLPNAPKASFLVLQNPDLNPATRTAFRQLAAQQLPVLSVYGGPAAVQQAQRLRNALGGRRGGNVRAYRDAGPSLLATAGPVPRFGSGLPGDVVQWLQGR